VPINSDFYVKSMAKRTASLLGNIENKSICDVGSGKGFLLQEILNKKPSKVTAIDIATKYLEKINASNVNRIVANAENLPFEEEFDVAVSTDVIEHVLNVGSFMYGINKMLKKGGLFVVRVPFRENLLQYGRHGGSPYPFTHLRTYNVDLLKHQVEQAGFRPIKLLFDGFQPAYPRSFFKSGIGAIIFKKLVTDRYPDYWSVTSISPYLGFVLMKPIEINLVCMKVRSLT
jgi:SAM-dependent methyltransferase